MMRSPEGQVFPNIGCFQEVIPQERLVWTDALLPGFRPAPKPFITGILTFTPHGTGTRYTATVLHADAEARKRHEEMGFHTGWATALDQLVAHAKTM